MSVVVVNYIALASALAQVFRPTTVRTFNGRSNLLRFLEKRKGSGKNVAWTWEGTGALGENYTDGQDVSNYGSDSRNAATLAWGMYRSNFEITDFAASISSSSQSPDDLIPLAAREFENANRKLASTLNVDGYAGAGTGTLIDGLADAVKDDNTYAGVDRTQAANAGFRSLVVDGLSQAPTIADLRSDISSIYDIGGEIPNIAFCPTAVWNKIASLFQEFRRYNQDVMVAGKPVTLDGSVSALEIDGCIFVKDKDATANTIYYLNTDHVHWEYLPFAGMEALMARMKEMGMSDGYGAIPLGMLVKALAESGAAQKMTCQVQLQLVLEKPNACGKRINVATT